MSNNQPEIILVCSDCDNTRILYHGIKDNIAIHKIIAETPVSKKQLIKRRIKNLGIITVVSQLIFQAGVVPVIRKLSKKKVQKIITEKGLNISSLPSDKVIKVASVNDSEFITTIQSLNPALIIVNGTRIISSKTLSAIKCPAINVHVGITPLYRGVHGAYWSLANNDRENCGVTIHAIDKGIDTGGILLQDTIQPGANDNFITYPYLQFEKAILLIQKIVPEILNGTQKFLTAPQGSSKLWYHPTIWQYIRNRFKGVK